MSIVFVLEVMLSLSLLSSASAQGECVQRSQGVPGNEYRVTCDGIRYFFFFATLLLCNPTPNDLAQIHHCCAGSLSEHLGLLLFACLY